MHWFYVLFVIGEMLGFQWIYYVPIIGTIDIYIFTNWIAHSQINVQANIKSIPFSWMEIGPIDWSDFSPKKMALILRPINFSNFSLNKLATTPLFFQFHMSYTVSICIYISMIGRHESFNP